MTRENFRGDRHVVVLRCPPRRRARQHVLHDLERAFVFAAARERFRKVRPREHHELRVVVARERVQRSFSELARGCVVADGDERRREIRHDRRMLRGGLAVVQRLQRFVQVANRVVEPIGEVMRGADCIEEPEPVLRRQHLLGFRVQREQPIASAGRVAFRDSEPRAYSSSSVIVFNTTASPAYCWMTDSRPV